MEYDQVETDASTSGNAARCKYIVFLLSDR
jgi:hypothetical protein